MYFPKKTFITLLFALIVNIANSQTRPFCQWDMTAFCSYTKYHPFAFIKADNNWDILQIFRNERTLNYLDSIGVRYTISQIMLLHTEGFIRSNGNDRWQTTIPILDSLQTVQLRQYSQESAWKLYRKIKNDCLMLVQYLQDSKLEKNAYSILFSHILDGKMWNKISSYDNLKSSSTWNGECWALYIPRSFSCGTNTYGERFIYNVTWSKEFPQSSNITDPSFISLFLEDYKQYGKIVNRAILQEALSLGLINEYGNLCIPVINSKDPKNIFNVYSDRIVDKIYDCLIHLDLSKLQTILNIDSKKLFYTIFYHEVMWDLIKILVDEKVIEYPRIWNTYKKSDSFTLVFIGK